MVVAEAKQPEKPRQFWPIGDRIEKEESLGNKLLLDWLQEQHSC